MPSRFDHNAEPPPTPAELEERRQQARQLGTPQKLGPSAPHITVVEHECSPDWHCDEDCPIGCNVHVCPACDLEEEEVLCPSCDKQGIRTWEECPSCNPYR